MYFLSNFWKARNRHFWSKFVKNDGFDDFWEFSKNLKNRHFWRKSSILTVLTVFQNSQNPSFLTKTVDFDENTQNRRFWRIFKILENLKIRHFWSKSSILTKTLKIVDFDENRRNLRKFPVFLPTLCLMNIMEFGYHTSLVWKLVIRYPILVKKPKFWSPRKNRKMRLFA